MAGGVLSTAAAPLWVRRRPAAVSSSLSESWPPPVAPCPMVLLSPPSALLSSSGVSVGMVPSAHSAAFEPLSATLPACREQLPRRRSRSTCCRCDPPHASTSRCVWREGVAKGTEGAPPPRCLFVLGVTRPIMHAAAYSLSVRTTPREPVRCGDEDRRARRSSARAVSSAVLLVCLRAPR